MLSIIIVNYRSREHIGPCLESIAQKIPPLKYEIVLVNNDPGRLEDYFSKIPFLKKIEVGRNIGFGAACNRGAKISQYEYLFFLNPDAQIISFKISQLLEKFHTNESPAIIAPRILSKDGSEQPWSYGREITLKSILANNLLLSEKKLPASHLFPDWVSGAAFFIERRFFSELGGFDEDFFMYFEDVDLCKRARTMGGKIHLYPDFEIRHLGGKSFSDIKIQKRLYYESQDTYFRKHHGKIHFLLLKLFRLLH